MFQRGMVYNRRRDIHDRIGGQRQGGIATPARQPFVVLFTGEAGSAHGYNDGWTPEGLFRYFGEGQEGDMQWVRGNAAIRDHAADGKDLLLFEMLGKGGGVRFLGQFVCAGYEETTAPDGKGTPRRAFVFDLLPLSDFESDTEPEPDGGDDLEQLRERAFAAASVAAQRSTGQAKRNVYERSTAVRRWVLARADGRCEGCSAPAPFVTAAGEPYLEPHHIRRLSDGGPDHPAHVIALCPNCHRRVHFGIDGTEYNRELAERIGGIEAQFG